MEGRESCEFGKTLMPTLIDRISLQDPDRPYAELIVDGLYRSISMSRLAKAIDRAAQWLKDQIRSTSADGYLAYAGPQDLRYLLLAIAGVKTSRPLFLPSLRNSLDAHLALFEAYKCRIMLMPVTPLIRDIFSAAVSSRQMTIIDVPDLGYFLTEHDIPRFGWNVAFQDVRDKPFVGLQTSGTTGIPKPVIMTHAMMSAMDAQHRLPSLGHDPIAFAHFENKRVLSCFPFFHGAGLGLSMSTIIFPSTIIYPPPQPVHARLVIDLINTRQIQAAALPPWTITEIAAEADGLDTLAKLNHLYYGGGPLPTSTIEVVSPITHLVAGFGTSEVGHYPVQMLDSKLAPYLKFSPLWGHAMRPELDGLFELVMLRDPDLVDYQSVFSTSPELQEYATRDLFSPHPTKDGLWKFEGRKDDIIVLSTGEKFNPISLEDAVNGHPAVKAALVAGTGQFQTALLIEPMRYPTSVKESEMIVEQVWPLVEEQNRSGVSTGRVLKNMILVGTPEKPFLRAAKGTVQRRQTNLLYAPEISSLFDPAHDTLQEANSPSGRLMSIQDVESAILKAAEAACGLSIESHANLFDMGLDSLGVITLLRQLRRDLPGDLSYDLTARDIYEAKTIRLLADRLFGTKSSPKDSLSVLQQIYEQCVSNMITSSRTRETTIRPKRRVILLTGSTGTFGSYFLDRLNRDDTVAEVICTHRDGASAERQIKFMQEDRSYSLREWIQKPVSFIKADLSRPYLGLEQNGYSSLLDKVTHIVHNAWQVNFNLPVEQFQKSHIQGLNELINFSARSRSNASLIFISSISAVSAYKAQPDSQESGIQRIPERIINDWAAAEDTGYSQSKLVSERILAAAAEKCNMPCAVYRLGQIAGPTSGNGCWPKQEWLPSILISSKHLGYLPSSLGQLSVIDWIPVDTMATIVNDWLCDEQQPKNGECSVRHGVHPNKILWDDILPHLKEQMCVSEVPLEKWLELVANKSEETLDRNPALRLLDFFKNLGGMNDRCAELDTALSAQASAILRHLQPADKVLFDTWLRQLGLIE